MPKLRKHSTRNVAFIELAGKRVSLGSWDGTQPVPQDVQAAYDRTITTLMANARRGQHEITTVKMLLQAYRAHAEQHYVGPDGKWTSTLARHRTAAKYMRLEVGARPVAELGPVRLQAIRDRMIRDELARSTVNQLVGVVRQIVRWGVANELVPAEVLTGLDAVTGLRRGRSKAKETEPVRPAPQAHIDQVRAVVSDTVRSLIDLQLATGARPGEVCGLRAVDIITTGAVWTAELRHHKQAWKGRTRVLYFGPTAQAVLRPWMERRDVSGVMFRTRTGTAFGPQSYAKAVRAACDQLEIPRWSPNQLRHTAATRFRAEGSLDGCQVLLGHANITTTQTYAEKDHDAAVALALRVG